MGDPETWFVTEEYARYAFNAVRQVADWVAGYRQELEETIGNAARAALTAAVAAAAAAAAAASTSAPSASSSAPGSSPPRSPRGWDAAAGAAAARALPMSPVGESTDNVV